MSPAINVDCSFSPNIFPTKWINYLRCRCWLGRTSRWGRACVHSGLQETCWMTSLARRFPGPAPQPSWATRRSPGASGRGWTGPGGRSCPRGAPPGGWATWPARCGRPAWWRGGWGRRTVAACSPPRTGYSRWCDLTLSAAASCTRTWPRCCAAAGAGGGRAAGTRPSPSAPGATGWRWLVTKTNQNLFEDSFKHAVLQRHIAVHWGLWLVSVVIEYSDKTSM